MLKSLQTKRFERFKIALNEICTSLDIDKKDVKIVTAQDNSSHNFDFNAEGNGKEYSFDFHVSTVYYGKTTVRATIVIQYSAGASPFAKTEDLDSTYDNLYNIDKWIVRKIFDFHIQHFPIHLDTLLKNSYVYVLGFPGTPHPSLKMAYLVINGVVKLKEKRITIYRFRHTDTDAYYVEFSYVFVIDYEIPIAFFFPSFGSPDSGSKVSLERTDSLIKKISKNMKVEIINYDLKYEDLANFLHHHQSTFRNPYAVELNEYWIPSEKVFGKIFVESYLNYKNELQKKDFSGALRHLRALLQEALEIGCKMKKIDIGEIKDADIANLSGKFIGGASMDGRLQPWFMAFTSISNRSSHTGDYPSTSEMEHDTFRDRFLLAYHLGQQLILEIENIIK